MLTSLHNSAAGMKTVQTLTAVGSNNLANASTIGFKEGFALVIDQPYQQIRAPGGQLPNGATLPTGLEIGMGSAVVATARAHTQGNLKQTEQSFDLAIDGDGFFTIQLPDGTTAYTRNGEFTRNANGDMVMSNGYQLTPNINIPANAISVTVSNAGLVEFTLPGGNNAAQAAGTIQLTTFINPQGLESIGGNLYLQTGASGDPQTGDPDTDNFGEIRQGFLEQSNVNVIDEMVNMISTSRLFDMCSKGVDAANGMLKTITHMSS